MRPMNDDTIHIEGTSRSAFLLRGAVATGAALGTGMIAPFVTRALAAGDTSDVDILNFALTLEYLETAFYADAQKLKLSGDAKRYAKQFGQTEAEHVAALLATIKKLGGKPVAKPQFKFPMTDQASFLKLAQTLEDTGVSAYNGAGPAIKNKEVLGAAGSIVQVEARHAAVIRLLNGELPAPDAFDPTLDQAQVTKLVTPFIAM
jgi:rubrerythrin